MKIYSIKESDVKNYMSNHAIGMSSGYKMQEGDIVQYNNKMFILTKSVKSLFGLDIYNLYTLDGELYKENIKFDDLKLVLPKSYYLDLVNELQSQSSSSSTPYYSSGGGGGGGGSYSPSRTGKSYTESASVESADATKDKNSTEQLDQNLGTQERTRKTVEQCQEMINKANEAVKNANLTIEKWEDVNNADGYAAQASIVFLNNLTNALTTLEKNLDQTKLSSLEVNDLNANVKELLVDFCEKEEKEEEKKAKEATLASTPKTKTVTNTDGTTSGQTNPEYTKIQEEITKLTNEIAEIDKEITEYQMKIDDKYKRIQEQYGNLLNFSNSSVKVPSNSTIFGKGNGSTTAGIEGADAYVIKNYMIANNLEYFEFGNSIYNIPSPYDPWLKQKITLDENYLIRYDMTKLQALANSGNQLATDAMNFIKGKANGSIPDSVRYYIESTENGSYYLKDGQYVKMPGKLKADLVPIMDTILNDSYEANGCKTATDYATTAMMVMSGGVYNAEYGGGAKPTQKGISGILGDCDCIGAVNWAMSQGILNTDTNANIKPLGLGYGVRTATGNVSITGNEDLPVGTVLTKQIPGNYHTAMVVGHTTINGVKYNVVVQTGNKKNGFNAHIITAKQGFDTAITTDNLKGKYYA